MGRSKGKAGIQLKCIPEKRDTTEMYSGKVIPLNSEVCIFIVKHKTFDHGIKACVFIIKDKTFGCGNQHHNCNSQSKLTSYTINIIAAIQFNS